MSKDRFKALLVDQVDEQIQVVIQEIEQEVLPPGEVLIAVAYSSLNYKDGLAVTGRGKVIRRYPMVPGIDLAGTVVESESAAFKPGDPVIVTGWGIGETHWGGYAQLARLKSDWILPLPAGLSLKQAMALGTAGFTAMLCVIALEERGLTPGELEVVVTGAAGGVGSIAVAVLAELGYKVVASTGRREVHDYLQRLGAHRIIDRSELAQPPRRPLESGRWGGAIDVVGGDTLASLLASMAPGTSVAACGVAGGSALNTTVFPFILRGISLLGIDSVQCSPEKRREVWARLSREISGELLDVITQLVSLAEIPEYSHRILKGQVRGRVVVDVNA